MLGNVGEWLNACQPLPPDAGIEDQRCTVAGGDFDTVPTEDAEPGSCLHFDSPPRNYAYPTYGVRCCAVLP